MDMLQESCFAIAVCLIVAYLWRKNCPQNGKQLPPGPRGWPIVGCLPNISTEAHLSFTDLADKYGDVVSLWLGNRLTIILSSPKVVKEAYRIIPFSGRPTNYLVKVYNPNFTGIVDGSYGEVWKKHRKFAMKTMGSFGLGKTSFENRILLEARCLQQTILSHSKPVDPGDLLVGAISNLICSIMLGRRFNYDDQEFCQILHMLRETFSSLVADKSRDYIPFLRYIPSNHVQNHCRLFEDIKTYIRSQIDEHRKKIDLNDLRDYIDAFLAESYKGTEDFTEDWLVNVIFDFFAAGTETTATALRWACLYLAQHQNIQEAAYKEIVDAIGREHEPCFEDQARMPFMEAIMCEILRLTSVAPLALVHSTLEDTEINDYYIPKNSDVYMNLWAMHHNPAYWPDPLSFKPERFLDGNGKCKRDIEAYLPFGTGYRACMGEQLAKMEFFLMLTTLLQTFAISFPDNNEPRSLQGYYKLVYEPLPCALVFRARTEP